MNVSDILILLAVAAAVVLAVFRIRARKKAGRGCCGGSCKSCGICSLCGKKPDDPA